MVDYPKEIDKNVLTKRQRLAIKLFGAIIIKKEQLPDGKYVEFLIDWCSKHKMFFEDNSQSGITRCPRCNEFYPVNNERIKTIMFGKIPRKKTVKLIIDENVLNDKNQELKAVKILEKKRYVMYKVVV